MIARSAGEIIRFDDADSVDSDETSVAEVAMAVPHRGKIHLRKLAFPWGRASKVEVVAIDYSNLNVQLREIKMEGQCSRSLANS